MVGIIIGDKNKNVIPSNPSVITQMAISLLTFPGSQLSVDCSKGCQLYRVCPHINWLEVDNKPYLVTADGQSVSPVRSYLTGEIIAIKVLSIAISTSHSALHFTLFFFLLTCML